MKVTRREMADTMKILLVSMLCAIPIVFILSLIIGDYVPTFVLVIIDCIILVGVAVIGYIIVDKRRKKIAAKRAEYEKNKK